MRTRKCRNCGKVFDVPSGSKAYLCKECSRESKINSVLRERTCRVCGASFMGYPRSFFCQECRAERKKHQKKIYNQRKPSRPLGSIDNCEACGNPYIVNSGRQRYCPECGKKKVKENIRAHKREYMAKNADKTRERKASILGKRYICPICGKEFGKHTPEVTCSSPECRKELKRIRQNKADIQRGKRKLPADQRYESGLPKSGVIGVTWKQTLGKWQAIYKRKYIGVYETVEQAVKAIEEYKNNPGE